jgi:predicted Zn finger-like uncharacterized protein
MRLYTLNESHYRLKDKDCKQMIITCEKCGTNYITPVAEITAKGRKVKCFKCQHIWYFSPGDDDPACDFDIECYGAYGQRGEGACIKHRSCTKWMIACMIMLIFATVILFYKDQLVRIYPPVLKLYNQTFLFSSDKVTIANLEIVEDKEAKDTVWLIGEVANQSTLRSPLPKLLLTIYDDQDQEIIQHKIIIEQPSLALGEVLYLRQKISNLATTADYITLDVGNCFELLLRKWLR